MLIARTQIAVGLLAILGGAALAALPTTWPVADGLAEAAKLMSFADGQMRQGRTGPTVTQAQDRVVAILDALLREAERREEVAAQASGRSGGRQRGVAGRQPAMPAGQSSLTDGVSEQGALRRSPVVQPGDAWGGMPPRQRESILQNLGKSFPSRYRELIEQYYRQVGGGE
jgi:hypothetical protein